MLPSEVRVLLVDDDYEDYLLTRDILSQIDPDQYTLEWVDSVDAALSAMEERSHDVYLVDYYLGDRTGLSLLEEAMRRQYKAPFIVLTGKGDYNIDLKAMASGAGDYLEKGQLDPQMLERSIRYSIERRRAKEEMQYRLELEKLITTISTTFINLGSREIGPAVGDALELIGRFAALDRCYIVSIDEQSHKFQGISHSWRRDSVPPPESPRAGHISDLPLVLDYLTRREVLDIPHVAGVSVELKAELERLLPDPEARSLIAVPLAYGRSIMGILLLESIFGEKHWKDEDVALLSMMGTVIVNAFERARAEEESRRLQKRLTRFEKMEAIGQLAAGIAHDLNNALTAVVGHLELMKTLAPADSQLNDSIDVASGGCQKAVTLVSQLLGYAQQGKYDPKPLSIGALLSDSLTYIGRPDGRNQRRLDDDVILISRPPREEVHIYGDERQLRQAIISMISYLKQSSDRKGAIEISVSKERIEHPEISNPASRPGEYVIISVSDDRGGIEAADTEKIFDPFFGLGGEERLSGLGLAAAYGIMQNHDGWTDAESEPGRRSTLRLYLPVFPSSALIGAGGPSDKEPFHDRADQAQMNR